MLGWGVTIMLEKVIGYKGVFTMWIYEELKGTFLTNEDWTLTEITHHFF